LDSLPLVTNHQRENKFVKRDICEEDFDNVITIAFAAVYSRQQDNKEIL